MLFQGMSSRLSGRHFQSESSPVTRPIYGLIYSNFSALLPSCPLIQTLLHSTSKILVGVWQTLHPYATNIRLQTKTLDEPPFDLAEIPALRILSKRRRECLSFGASNRGLRESRLELQSLRNLELWTAHDIRFKSWHVWVYLNLLRICPPLNIIRGITCSVPYAHHSPASFVYSCRMFRGYIKDDMMIFRLRARPEDHLVPDIDRGLLSRRVVSRYLSMEWLHKWTPE